MTEQELSEIKKNIIKLIEKLSASIPYLEGESKPIAPSVALGRLTRMEALSEKGVNEAILADNKVRLTRLENALTRIESGSYGICIRCKKEIPIGRLKAVPEALICIPCAEKKQR